MKHIVVLRRLAVIVAMSLLLLGCAPAVEALASPANAVFASPADAVTPANAALASPSDYVTPSNAEIIPADVDASVYPALTQELMDSVMAAFFEGTEVRYFSFASDAADDNAWIEKPSIGTEESGRRTYETMDAKAYQDGVVYDMWSFHEVSAVGFDLGIYGRNLMTEQEAEALRPSDGFAWMSMQQGLLGGEEPALIEREAEKAVSQQEAVEKACALLTAIGIAEPGNPSEIAASYRICYTGTDEQEAEKAEREYGWLVSFSPLPYETIQIGVTAAGYGQFYWSIQF